MKIFEEITPDLKQYDPTKHILTEPTFVFMDKDGLSWVHKDVELKDK